MPDTLPFRVLRPWLTERFGRPVHRVALDAGSTCPNRDGSKGFGGCTYCDVEGSGTGALKSGAELEAQLAAGIARVARRDAGGGVIAYFQSYSNTYVERERLRAVLGVVDPYLDGKPVVAVSIATRPDTLPPEALAELARLAERTEVWVELGLEAANDRVLDDIRRFHTVDDFRWAVERCHEAGLQVIGHAILGLPGDGREGARRTAEVLAETGVIGVKVHNLMVLRRTQMEKSWKAGELEVLDAATYVDWLADFVERLDPRQVLHRITGDAPVEERLAPRWDVHKNAVRDLLAAELERRGTRQGSAHGV
ncbi:MAG: TIGR01212 family radical SAM protein [Planctomycetes bacterium]|nr:TIGR01212 family radical SAM protein [Planctomycetota bacterium]MCB9905387.1 TIGR01212 family radical SAM protein [Planctomycetota bacterium]